MYVDFIHVPFWAIQPDRENGGIEMRFIKKSVVAALLIAIFAAPAHATGRPDVGTAWLSIIAWAESALGLKAGPTSEGDAALASSTTPAASSAEKAEDGAEMNGSVDPAG